MNSDVQISKVSEKALLFINVYRSVILFTSNCFMSVQYIVINHVQGTTLLSEVDLGERPAEPHVIGFGK